MITKNGKASIQFKANMTRDDKTKLVLKTLGFKNNNLFPCSMGTDSKGNKVARPFDWGDFSFVDKDKNIKVSTIPFEDGGSCTIAEINVPFKELCKPNIYFTNHANPREAIYTTKRKEAVSNMLFNPSRIAFAHGVSIIVDEMRVEDGVIYFKLVDLNTGELKGIVDGQHLYSIILSILKGVVENIVPYPYNLDELYVPFHFYMFNNASREDLAEICKIKNFTIVQTNTAIATMSGDFEQYIFDSIKNGIEIKRGQSAKEFVYLEDITSNGEDCYMHTLVDIVHYFQYAYLIFLGAKINNEYEDTCKQISVKKKDPTYNKSQKDSAEDDIVRTSVTPIITKARNTSLAAKEFTDGRKKNSLPTYHSALNENLIHSFFFDAFDYVLSYDYSDVSKNVLDILAIYKNVKNELTPFTKEKKLYSIPNAILNFIPVLFGVLCDSHEDEETLRTVLDAPMAFKVFWSEKHKEILEDIAEFRKDKSDSYCYTDSGNNVKGYRIWWKVITKAKKWQNTSKKSKDSNKSNVVKKSKAA